MFNASSKACVIIPGCFGPIQWLLSELCTLRPWYAILRFHRFWSRALAFQTFLMTVYMHALSYSRSLFRLVSTVGPPQDLDPELTTVHDLRAEIQRVPRISLKVGSITDVIQGPGTDKLREEFDQKSEEQLI